MGPLTTSSLLLHHSLTLVRRQIPPSLSPLQRQTTTVGSNLRFPELHASLKTVRFSPFASSSLRVRRQTTYAATIERHSRGSMPVTPFLGDRIHRRHVENPRRAVRSGSCSTKLSSLSAKQSRTKARTSSRGVCSQARGKKHSIRFLYFYMLGPTFDRSTVQICCSCEEHSGGIVGD